MAPEEAPLRCLAVRAVADEAGEIDGLELELFMNAVAGPHQWISTTEWLFISPPAEAAGEITVPVVVPEAIAIKAILADLTNAPQRIVFDHATTPGETRKWRWVAFQTAPNAQGQGRFPWERFNA
ncbi:hypothetical protein U0030_01055 [Brevundimonas bullata]|uniref:hypothetical protein n=1 Tax=Brevundimonas TaxID=41275 RepID=UPI000DB52B46|nr:MULTISPECIES: hypothetical protein [Brevundimonas]PZP10005.1 MAG: hypothetical protein DI607_11950 [Sphingomonas hengshuiensis]PZT95399.1 MAG: hypothetical protein DI624_13580 [Brevundimonas sp.]WQE37088.1 hypothetical protein U0030_01055 [Brevundimonas bullata]